MIRSYFLVSLLRRALMSIILDARRGIEPQFLESNSSVLPLDDRAMVGTDGFRHHLHHFRYTLHSHSDRLSFDACVHSQSYIVAAIKTTSKLGGSPGNRTPTPCLQSRCAPVITSDPYLVELRGNDPHHQHCKCRVRPIR